jgi:hypothetical protein
MNASIVAASSRRSATKRTMKEDIKTKGKFTQSILSGFNSQLAIKEAMSLQISRGVCVVK